MKIFLALREREIQLAEDYSQIEFLIKKQLRQSWKWFYNKNRLYNFYFVLLLHNLILSARFLLFFAAFFFGSAKWLHLRFALRRFFSSVARKIGKWFCVFHSFISPDNKFRNRARENRISAGWSKWCWIWLECDWFTNRLRTESEFLFDTTESHRPDNLIRAPRARKEEGCGLATTYNFWFGFIAGTHAK